MIRFFGSTKLTSGYYFKAERELTRDETKHYVPYLFATSYAAKGHEVWVISGTPQIRQYKNLQFGLIEEGNKLLISCAGLPANDFKNYIKLLYDAALNILGMKGSSYQDAVDFYTNEILPNYGDKEIEISGFCSGGAIASYLALRFKKKGYCFNSLPLGAGLQQEIGDETLLRAHEFVTHVNIRGDWMSDWSSKLWILFNRALAYLRIRTPGSFGHCYEIPSIYSDSKRTHRFYSGSMMAHIFGKDVENPEGIRNEEYLNLLNTA